MEGIGEIPRATNRHSSRIHVARPAQLRYDWRSNGTFGYVRSLAHPSTRWQYKRKCPVGIVLRQLPDTNLKQHMLLNVEKWSTYEKLRAEIENITRAQIAANSSTSPMDLVRSIPNRHKGTRAKEKGEALALVQEQKKGTQLLAWCGTYARRQDTLLETVGIETKVEARAHSNRSSKGKEMETAKVVAKTKDKAVDNLEAKELRTRTSQSVGDVVAKVTEPKTAGHP
eukprot:824072-Amphidinium_carterae.7